MVATSATHSVCQHFNIEENIHVINMRLFHLSVILPYIYIYILI